MCRISLITESLRSRHQELTLPLFPIERRFIKKKKRLQAAPSSPKKRLICTRARRWRLTFSAEKLGVLAPPRHVSLVPMFFMQGCQLWYLPCWTRKPCNIMSVVGACQVVRSKLLVYYPHTGKREPELYCTFDAVMSRPPGCILHALRDVHITSHKW